MRAPRSILITGASRGLGAALARAFAAPGVQLVLSARTQADLDSVAAGCRALGASASVAVADVTDAPAMAALIAAADEAGPLDLVLANAGISAGTAGGAESEAQTRRILAVNIDGVVNTVAPALDRMRRRGRGQIAIMSSLAGFRGYPGAPAYCASKAAIRVWGEALRARESALGIEVSVICPGFVRTAMTAGNAFPMPLLMDAEPAARIIRRGLARNRGRIAFPWPVYAATRLFAALPGGVVDPLMRRLPHK